MVSFYSETIGVFIGLSVLVYYIRKECLKDFDKIEGSLGHEWYVIKSHIWSNDVKNSVKDLSKYIEEESESYATQGSSDPLVDVFSDSDNLTILNNRLNELVIKYSSYLSFHDIIVNFSTINELFKKWVDFMLGLVIVFCFWGLAGVFITWQNLQIQNLFIGYWSLFIFLSASFLIILFNVIKYYNQINKIKKKIRTEKSNYSYVLEGNQHV